MASKKEEKPSEADKAQTNNKNDKTSQKETPTKKKKKTKKEEGELSTEDQQLKDTLDEYASLILDKDYDNVAQVALDKLKDEIRSSTSSMTSVPKPLKFLKNHYTKIKEFFTAIDVTKEAKKHSDYADLMSILAMTMEDPQTRLCLKYRLMADVSLMAEWGTQYIKHLAAEIRIEMEQHLLAEEDPEKTTGLVSESSIMSLVDGIVAYYMKHNAEHDGIDLLLEVERKELITKYCKKHNHERVCEYLRSCAKYLPPPDDIEIYTLCYNLYLKFNNFYHALRYALKLDNKELVTKVMKLLNNRPLMKRQCAYLLGWHQYNYEDDDEDDDEDEDGDAQIVNQNDDANNTDIEAYEIAFKKVLNGGDDDAAGDDDDDADDDDVPDVSEIIANVQLSEAFHSLAQDLDVLEPKDPKTDIFKEQLMESTSKDATGSSATQVLSARKSLAMSYVNAFVNCGYGRDKYMISSGSDLSQSSNNITAADEWVAKNTERGQLASVASIGTIMLWDEEAVNCVDRYFESQQAHIRAGAYLAIGMSCSGMRSESGVGLALLSAPSLNEDGKKNKIERLCAILGLGLSYAGQSNEEVFEILSQLISIDEPDDVSSLAALCLGYAYVGTCNSEIGNLILADLMEREGEALDNPLYLLNCLGLSLLFLGKQDEVEVTLEAVQVFSDINAKFCKTLEVCLECLAYAGTGNVLKIQRFLGILGEHFDEDAEEKDGDKKEEKKADDDDDDDEENKDKYEDYRYYQSIATLGISIIALGEDLGVKMTLRMFNHLIQYGNIRVKRSVPLALAMISVSNPLLEISDVLSKLSHDADEFVSKNAIISLGIIGAGTNNSRIARMLRDLTAYYEKDADHLYMIRIAQGLIHFGKGLLTIKSYHSDRFLMSKVSICGILTVLFCNIGTGYPPKKEKGAAATDDGSATKGGGKTFGNSISLIGDMHYLLYTLTLAIKPRMLITLDDKKLKPLMTTVRVGQSVDTVGAAGKNPKKITGFQTHETPILLGYSDRAILATDEYVSIAPVMEGFAILTENPESDLDRKIRKRKEKKARKDKLLAQKKETEDANKNKPK